MSPRGCASRSGDPQPRQLLVQAARYILGPFGPDPNLRRWGERYAGTGADNAKKRAADHAARAVEREARGQAEAGLECVGGDVRVRRRRRDADRRLHPQRRGRRGSDRPVGQIHEDRGRARGAELVARAPLDHDVMHPFSQERRVGRDLNQPRPRFALDRARLERVRVPDRDVQAQGRLRTPRPLRWPCSRSS